MKDQKEVEELSRLTKEILELAKNDSIYAVGYCEIIKDCILTLSKKDIIKKQILDLKDSRISYFNKEI